VQVNSYIFKDTIISINIVKSQSVRRRIPVMDISSFLIVVRNISATG
jgi:hypothetical protein